MGKAATERINHPVNLVNPVKKIGAGQELHEEHEERQSRPPFMSFMFLLSNHPRRFNALRIAFSDARSMFVLVAAPKMLGPAPDLISK